MNSRQLAEKLYKEYGVDVPDDVLTEAVVAANQSSGGLSVNAINVIMILDELEEAHKFGAKCRDEADEEHELNDQKERASFR